MLILLDITTIFKKMGDKLNSSRLVQNYEKEKKDKTERKREEIDNKVKDEGITDEK